MSSVRVETGGENAIVEVFHPKRGPVARGVSPSAFELEPGRYVVQVRLPGGEQRQQAVDVKPGAGPTTVELRSAAALERAKLERTELRARRSVEPEARRASARARADRLSRKLKSTPDLLMWRPRRLEFRLEPTEIELLHRAGPDEWQPVPYDPASSSAPLPPPGAASVDALSIRPPHGPRTYMPVPGGHLRYYDFSELAIARGGKPAVRLVDEQANDLLAYLDRGWLDDALLLSEDFAGYAEIMLLRKRKDPVAAAAGAFALLRLGALDRLHDWTANLLEWFAWLPDGLVARAEHVARLGDHDAASALLRQLPERGVPVLSVGLATAVDRLRAYAAAWPEDEALRTASEWSTRYAVATDFSLPITTYFGRGPDAPEPPSGAAELARS